MKNRLFIELKKHIAVCFIGFVYYLWISITGVYIPCIFRMITNLKCPGCGITHMIMGIFRLDFPSAFRANPILFVALPVMGIIYITKKAYYIRNGTKMKTGRIMNFLTYTFIIMLFIFFIVRNFILN